VWPQDVNGVPIQKFDAHGIENFNRLSQVTEVVFGVLEPSDRKKVTGDKGEAYLELLDRAREYFTLRTTDAFDNMTCSGVPMPVQ